LPGPKCGKFGAVANIVIPRPDPSGQVVPGLGKVFVQYVDVAGALAARNALHGRKCGGQIVKADYLSEQDFASRNFF
jgi:splicing factor U2AF subunit